VRGEGEAHAGFWWGTLKETKPLGRPRRKWEDNIKMFSLLEVGGACSA